MPAPRPSDLHRLSTPALILDRERLVSNTAAMTRRAAELGLRLRPHLKTSKSIDVARLALDGNFGGIAVATLHEAEYFAEAGLTDILYAVCLSPDKLPRAAALADRGVQLGLITDDASAARALAAFTGERDVAFDAYVEVDCGDHRTGVDAGSDELIEIGRLLHEGKTHFAGVLTHAGHAYHCRRADEIADVAEQERADATRAAERLRAAGVPCEQVSIGSTPTVIHARSAEGVTEVRPGVYVFGDLFQAAIGSCALEDIAVTVLATVIGHRPKENGLVLDAGGLALSKDRSTAGTDADAGYGLLLDVTGGRLLEGLRVAGVHQEHGQVEAEAPIDFARFPIGSRVRVLPNHACMTASAYDGYHVVNGPQPEITAYWDRSNGWT